MGTRMRAALVLIAILLLVSFTEQVFGAPDDFPYGLNPARVWFARPGAAPPGHIFTVRPDCGALVVEREDRLQLPSTMTHCARV